MLRTTLVLVLLAASVQLGCSKDGDGGAPASTGAPGATGVAPKPAATAAAAASASASAIAAASAAVEPPVYPPRKVAGGMLTGMWVQPFEIVRDKGNVGLSYLDAMNRCVGYGKVLCTDSEWARACETDANLSKIETWTASGVGSNRFVTRGGDDAGCRARNVKDGDEKSPGRAAVCCDMNIAIRTTSKNDELLTGSIKKLFAYQRALRDKDGIALSGLYPATVAWLGKAYSNGDIVKVHQESFAKDPQQWTLFDTCTMASDPGSDDAGTHAKVTADCLTIFQRKGAVVVAMQRLVFGSEGKITLIGDATTANLPAADGSTVHEKELKERVGILLSAD